MHPYLPHLLSDIAAAHRTEPIEAVYPENFEEEMEEMERWLEGEDPEHTFGYYCGLSTEQFPPAEQLTPNEMQLVCKGFNQMMFSWNLSAEIPDTLPIDRYYELLVSTLNMKTDIADCGIYTFEFCQCYPPDCVLKEYCPCLEFLNIEETDLPRHTPGDLPF